MNRITGGESSGLKWAIATMIIVSMLALAACMLAGLATYSRITASDQARADARAARHREDLDTCRRFNRLYAGFRQQFDQARVTLNRTAYYNAHPVEKQRALDQLNADERKYEPIVCN